MPDPGSRLARRLAPRRSGAIAGCRRTRPTDLALDDPFWSAWQTRHRAVALRHGAVARLPVAFAPFLAVADAGVDAGAASESLVAADERSSPLGVARRVPPQ